ncbi:MAG: insulinase family protein [Micropruina glycogenica]
MAPVVHYPLHQATLDNGLRVIVNPDPSVPVVAVNLWYDVGSRDERPGRTGLAHLFEHLMFRRVGERDVRRAPPPFNRSAGRPTPPPGSTAPTTSRPCRPVPSIWP